MLTRTFLRLAVAFASFYQNHAFSLLELNQQKSPPPIKRVAIIGAGIGGLSLAHVLGNSEECASMFLDKVKKSDVTWNPKSSSVAGIDVQLFEARSNLDFSAGSGVQLTGGNGKNTFEIIIIIIINLKKNSHQMQPLLFTRPLKGMAVMKKTNQVVQQSIAKAALPLKTIRSKTKPWILSENKKECELFNFDIESAVRNQGDDVQSKLIVDNEVMAYAIMRGELQVRNNIQYIYFR